METVEVVIRIPKFIYDETLENGFFQPIYGGIVAKCFEQGTVLPKGHGKLIDIKSILVKPKYLKDVYGVKMIKLSNLPTILNETFTVIEADKDGE